MNTVRYAKYEDLFHAVIVALLLVWLCGCASQRRSAESQVETVPSVPVDQNGPQESLTGNPDAGKICESAAPAAEPAKPDPTFDEWQAQYAELTEHDKDVALRKFYRTFKDAVLKQCAPIGCRFDMPEYGTLRMLTDVAGSDE